MIDSDYRGEVKIIMFNHSDTDLVIEKGQKAAQMVFLRCGRYEIAEREELDATARGEGETALVEMGRGVVVGVMGNVGTMTT